ncbi:dihydrofolate reductase family protein [Actinomycetospora straminea]|uniref:Pyrimidine reductase family protein n=1 Tax=Actinomycetospora straminea TaxID=663607 RepID=A0ABP9F7U0_9PSEU|nr:dihydrofolate reductase family protein [Actinomycetospora straminea]MDD7934756.1 dihydrofolate reductase family protein [Actinomycetospora straminea]
MRQLLPHPVDPIDPVDVYAGLPAADGRPALRLNMIASVDGAITVGGVSGPLGGAGDHRVFTALRSFADAILVAAGTVRAEGYGPASVPLVIVTRSCQLDLDAPLFTETPVRPVVVTVATAPSERRERAAEVADVLVAGERDVDLPAALCALGRRGHASVLAEGGPTLNAQLARADLIDELCLTVSPVLAGGDAGRILAGPPLPSTHRFAPVSVCEDDGFLFLRLRPATERTTDPAPSRPASPASRIAGL